MEEALGKMSVVQKAKWDATYKVSENDAEVKALIASCGLNADTIMANAEVWG